LRSDCALDEKRNQCLGRSVSGSILKLLSCSARALIGKHDQCLGQSGSISFQERSRNQAPIPGTYCACLLAVDAMWLRMGLKLLSLDKLLTSSSDAPRIGLL
jgi:hypothetical protein